jgi:hypothetical protein
MDGDRRDHRQSVGELEVPAADSTLQDLSHHLDQLNNSSVLPIRSVRDCELNKRYRVVSFSTKITQFGERVVLILATPEANGRESWFQYYLPNSFTTKVDELINLRKSSSKHQLMFYIAEIRFNKNVVSPLCRFEIVNNSDGNDSQEAPARRHRLKLLTSSLHFLHSFIILLSAISAVHQFEGRIEVFHGIVKLVHFTFVVHRSLINRQTCIKK